MKRKLWSLLAGAALIALAGAASAGQPVSLTDTQMDRVTAGDFAFATANSIPIGNVSTFSHSIAASGVVAGISALGQGFTIGTATSAGIQASSTSGSTAGGGLSQL